MEKALNPIFFPLLLYLQLASGLHCWITRKHTIFWGVDPSLVILHGVCELQDMCEKGLCTILDTLPLL